MPWYEFESQIALDAPTGAIARNAEGQVFATSDTTFTTPLAVQDLAGVPRTALVSNNLGLIEPFQVEDQKLVNWKSGPYIVPVLSIQGVIADGEANRDASLAAQAAAEQAASLSSLPEGGTDGQVLTVGPDGPAWQPPAQATSGITGAPTAWPSTFPPSAHTHPAGQISDATTVGQALIKAVDQAAARAAIAAGTGNGTSNLALGTTGTTAAPGNHTHAAAALAFVPPTGMTATDVQSAIAEVNTKASAGGGGTGTIPAGTLVERRYTAGAYPVRGTLPAGTVVWWAGPVQPLIGGNYAIAGVDHYVLTAS